MALTQARDPYEAVDQRLLPSVPVAASTTIYAGGVVCINSAGYAVPASALAGLTVYGVAQETVDNSAGANGALNLERVYAGIFHFTNSGTDPVTFVDVTNTVYAEADDIAARGQNAAGTLPVLGKFLGIDTDHGAKVWVGQLGQDLGAAPVVVSMDIPDLSTADEVYMAAPVAGTVLNVYTCIDAAITGADAVVTAEINGTPITGVSITVANAGSAPGDVDTAVATAANVVAAGDTLSAVTDGASTTTSLTRVTFVILPS